VPLQSFLSSSSCFPFRGPRRHASAAAAVPSACTPEPTKTWPLSQLLEAEVPDTAAFVRLNGAPRSRICEKARVPLAPSMSAAPALCLLIFCLPGLSTSSPTTWSRVTAAYAARTNTPGLQAAEALEGAGAPGGGSDASGARAPSLGAGEGGGGDAPTPAAAAGQAAGKGARPQGGSHSSVEGGFR
jgi:hypothetical protein